MLKHLFGTRKKSIEAPPLPGVGGALSGFFEVRVDRVVGWVDQNYGAEHGWMKVDFYRYSHLITTCDGTWEKAHGRHSFGFAIEGRFTSKELATEEVVAYARNYLGEFGRIRLDGAAQIELIRDHLSAPSEPILDLDFSHGGNSRPFLKAGWSGAERDFTWTVDDDSVIEFDAPTSEGSYVLRFTTFAHIRVPEIPLQELAIFVNGANIAELICSERFPQFREVGFAGDVFGKGPRATIMLRHPHGARPSDFGHPDGRKLALAFKRLTLARLL